MALWVVLCVLFVLPFVDVRRPFRMLHLDLVVLVGCNLLNLLAVEVGRTNPALGRRLLHLPHAYFHST